MKLQATVMNTDRLALQVKYLIQAARFGLTAGVDEAALVIETAAKENAPVLTGRLRSGIHTERTIEQDERQQRKVTPVVDAANKEGFSPPYARRIELGFVGQDSLGRVYHQPPQPYMRPAADEHGGEALAAIKDSVYQELKAAHAR